MGPAPRCIHFHWDCPLVKHAKQAIIWAAIHVVLPLLTEASSTNHYMHPYVQSNVLAIWISFGNRVASHILVIQAIEQSVMYHRLRWFHAYINTWGSVAVDVIARLVAWQCTRTVKRSFNHHAKYFSNRHTDCTENTWIEFAWHRVNASMYIHLSAHLKQLSRILWMNLLFVPLKSYTIIKQGWKIALLACCRAYYHSLTRTEHNHCSARVYLHPQDTCSSANTAPPSSALLPTFNANDMAFFGPSSLPTWRG